MLVLNFTDYQWEPQSRRYRNTKTGRFLSRQAIATLTQLRIAQVTQELQEIGNALLNNQITLKDWQQQTAQALKVLHTQQFLLGVGGEAQIQPPNYQLITDELVNQYKYLANFANDLVQGKASSAQFKMRLGMYAQAAKVSYFRGEKEAARRSGFDGAMRVLGDNDNHCPECVEYASRGLVPIDDVVEPTQFCSCMTSCYCSLIFGKLEDAIKKPKAGDRLLDQIKAQILELSPRQIKELIDDYKLDVKGNADILKQRFLDFISTKNQIQLNNINQYIQQVKARV